MFKTKEEFAREKAKMTSVKSSITRSCKTVERLCTRLEEMLGKAEFPEITARKTAQDIIKNKGLIESHLEDLEIKGEALMEVIFGMKAEETAEKDPDKMVKKVSEAEAASDDRLSTRPLPCSSNFNFAKQNLTSFTFKMPVVTTAAATFSRPVRAP